MSSQDLTREIDALEQQLSDARLRAENDAAAFSALEQQIAELRSSLDQRRAEIVAHESRLAEKREELAEAKRLEALGRYQEGVSARLDAADTVIRAADELVEAVSTYDDETLRLRRLLSEMRQAFGVDDQRVVEVEVALADEPDALRDAWADVSGTVGWRVSRDSDEEDRSELIVDPPGEARQRPRARIMEYLGRS